MSGAVSVEVSITASRAPMRARSWRGESARIPSARELLLELGVVLGPTAKATA